MADLATVPNQWETRHRTEGGGCFWCAPDDYPSMPEDHSLCARCGVLITAPGLDPQNLGMVVCDGCDPRVAAEVKQEREVVDTDG